MELQNPTIMEGNPLAANDTTQAMVRATLAGQLGLHPGSQITVVGGVRATIAQLTVKAVFSTGTPLDNEVVAPLWVGEWLRGLGYGTVSILRIEVVAQQTASQVAPRVQQAIKSAPGALGAGQAPAVPGLPITASLTSYAGHQVEASPAVSSAFFSKTVGLLARRTYCSSPPSSSLACPSLSCALSKRRSSGRGTSSAP